MKTVIVAMIGISVVMLAVVIQGRVNMDSKYQHDLGVSLTRAMRQTMKQLEKNVNGNERQIDAIASSMGKTYDTAKNDIQKMIDKGYLKNAYINEGTREVVLPNNNIQAHVGIAANTTANNITPRIVSCPCCGANNTIIGDMGECEYCGSPLK